MAINGSKEKLIKTFQIRHMIKLLERNKDKNNKSKKMEKIYSNFSKIKFEK